MSELQKTQPSQLKNRAATVRALKKLGIADNFSRGFGGSSSLISYRYHMLLEVFNRVVSSAQIIERLAIKEGTPFQARFVSFTVKPYCNDRYQYQNEVVKEFCPTWLQIFTEISGPISTVYLPFANRVVTFDSEKRQTTVESFATFSKSRTIPMVVCRYTQEFAVSDHKRYLA